MSEPIAQISVSLTVNGRLVRADVEPHRLLVDFLRADLGLTGTHVGCDTSQCGACTVHLDGVAVKSCTVLVAQASGGTVATIEGVAGPNGLHPVQAAFHEHHALQCGYCTPGMVMIALDILRREPLPTADFIRHNLEGNLCRCTGYQNIVRAIEAAGRTLAGQAARAEAAS
jgi:carbon-monoxide dehydrogenase small subunit